MSYDVKKIIEQIQTLENNMKESQINNSQKDHIILEKESKINQLTLELESLKKERTELIEIIKNLILENFNYKKNVNSMFQEFALKYKENEENSYNIETLSKETIESLIKLLKHQYQEFHSTVELFTQYIKQCKEEIQKELKDKIINSEWQIKDIFESMGKRLNYEKNKEISKCVELNIKRRDDSIAVIKADEIYLIMNALNDFRKKIDIALSSSLDVVSKNIENQNNNLNNNQNSKNIKTNKNKNVKGNSLKNSGTLVMTLNKSNTKFTKSYSSENTPEKILLAELHKHGLLHNLDEIINECNDIIINKKMDNIDDKETNEYIRPLLVDAENRILNLIKYIPFKVGETIFASFDDIIKKTNMETSYDINFDFDKVFSINGNNIIFNSKLNYKFYLSMYSPIINDFIDEIYSSNEKIFFGFLSQLFKEVNQDNLKNSNSDLCSKVIIQYEKYFFNELGKLKENKIDTVTEKILNFSNKIIFCGNDYICNNHTEDYLKKKVYKLNVDTIEIQFKMFLKNLLKYVAIQCYLIRTNRIVNQDIENDSLKIINCIDDFENIEKIINSKKFGESFKDPFKTSVTEEFVNDFKQNLKDIFIHKFILKENI